MGRHWAQRVLFSPDGKTVVTGGWDGNVCLWAAGWGKVAMPGDYAHISTYFWIPIVGPLIGAAIASFLYDLGIRGILIARKPPEPGVVGEGETVQDRPDALSE